MTSTSSICVFPLCNTATKRRGAGFALAVLTVGSRPLDRTEPLGAEEALDPGDLGSQRRLLVPLPPLGERHLHVRAALPA